MTRSPLAALGTTISGAKLLDHTLRDVHPLDRVARNGEVLARLLTSVARVRCVVAPWVPWQPSDLPSKSWS